MLPFQHQSGFPSSQAAQTKFWFGLITTSAADVDIDLPSDAHCRDRNASEPTSRGDDATNVEGSSAVVQTTVTGDSNGLHDRSEDIQVAATASASNTDTSAQDKERQIWDTQDAVHLEDHDHVYFQHFITHVSSLIDLFDPMKHFSTIVPHLSLRNAGLMQAILALGARHDALEPATQAFDRTAAVQYYSESLQYLQSNMRYASYKNSAELLATTMVVSTYEMLDGAGKGWERHLKGVFWIQRNREINGESGGLEQAIWWAWLRQDLWAAFRERRRCYSFFQPTKLYSEMSDWDMASRAVYLLAQCVNYSSAEEERNGLADMPARVARADELHRILDEWSSNTSPCFNALPLPSSSGDLVERLWINPPAFGVAVQLRCAARILLIAHRPGINQARSRTIIECVDQIGGIASALTDDASLLMSTQCLFIAGAFCKDGPRRERILGLLRVHTIRTGWPSNEDLTENLKQRWQSERIVSSFCS